MLNVVVLQGIGRMFCGSEPAKYIRDPQNQREPCTFPQNQTMLAKKKFENRKLATKKGIRGDLF